MTEAIPAIVNAVTATTKLSEAVAPVLKVAETAVKTVEANVITEVGKITDLAGATQVEKLAEISGTTAVKLPGVEALAD